MKKSKGIGEKNYITRIIIIFLVIGIVLAGFSFWSTATIDNETVNIDSLKNSDAPLKLLDAYGDIEAYHPKVVSFETSWNGYKYWMSFSPYPKGDDSKENPHILASNDLLEWVEPEGFKNPLDEIGEQ